MRRATISSGGTRGRAARLLVRVGARVAGAALAFAVPGVVTLDARSPGRAGISRALAQEDWFVEFEAVCSKTQDAMTLSADELRALVARCDALKPRIEALDPSRRKVFTKRLQLCRDLYQFVLDTREAK